MLTHGFLDRRRRPQDVEVARQRRSSRRTVIKESGAEILRLWVAMSRLPRRAARRQADPRSASIEAYRKFRNTLRYLASNLYDFDPATDRVPLERDAGGRSLRRCRATARRPRRCCAATSATTIPAIFQTLNQFLTVDLSAFYADVSKDRLYTFAAGSPERRSAQTAMYVMADGLARLLAPILPVTADELWRHLPRHAREESVHLADFPRDVERLRRRRLDARWTRLREDPRRGQPRARDRAAGRRLIGTSLAARVTLTAGGDDRGAAARYEADLPMLFIVSQVTLDAAAPRASASIGVARRRAKNASAAGASSRTISRAPGTDGSVQPLRRRAAGGDRRRSARRTGGRVIRTRRRPTSDPSRGDAGRAADGRSRSSRAAAARQPARDRRHRRPSSCVDQLTKFLVRATLPLVCQAA